MPVTATAAGNPGGCTDVPSLPGSKPPSPAAVSCVGQHVLAPNNPQESVKGTPLLTKTKAFHLKGRQRATLEYQLIDKNGSPVDLVDCLCVPEATDESSSSSLKSSSSSQSSTASESLCPNYVEFRFQEYLTRGKSDPNNTLFVREATIVEAAEGRVSVTLEPAETKLPGVYFGEFALVERPADAEDAPIVLFSNSFYIHVGRDLYTAVKSGNGASAMGPPSIAEIRLHLRDTDPAESFLLDNVKFDDAEIAQATYLPVEEWNETPPPLATYSTTSFPYRYHWLMAIAGHLFLIAAEHQRANNLTYSASGVSLDDMNKEPNYEKAAAERLLQWRRWMRHKKAEINLTGAIGEVGSPYYYN